MRRHLQRNLKKAARQLHSGPHSLTNFSIDARTPLGIGAHSSVYWAREHASEQSVAIKVMTPHAPKKCTRPGELDGSIAKETQAFDELLPGGESHPNVVDLVAQFVCPGDEARNVGLLLPRDAYNYPLHCFVTEFLGGGSLTDRMKYRNMISEKFEAHEVLEVALAVSDGLQFLHTRGVVHRDVKPDNLVYSNCREKLKLIDFSLAGVACLGDSQSKVHGDVGTQGYQAPEVLLSAQQKGYDHKCDIFSLGCVMHAMLEGEPPKVDVSMGSARVDMKLSDRLSLPTRRFVADLLAINPLDRPTAAEVFNECSRLNLPASRAQR